MPRNHLGFGFDHIDGLKSCREMVEVVVDAMQFA